MKEQNLEGLGQAIPLNKPARPWFNLGESSPRPWLQGNLTTPYLVIDIHHTLIGETLVKREHVA